MMSHTLCVCVLGGGVDLQPVRPCVDVGPLSRRLLPPLSALLPVKAHSRWASFHSEGRNGSPEVDQDPTFPLRSQGWREVWLGLVYRQRHSEPAADRFGLLPLSDVVTAETCEWSAVEIR